jgi:FKBP-type peptidyl-prolyl cis-trans isomerase FkpA
VFEVLETGIPEMLDVLRNPRENGDVRLRLTWVFKRLINHAATMQKAIPVLTKICEERANNKEQAFTRYQCAALLAAVQREKAPESALDALRECLGDPIGKLYDDRGDHTGDPRVGAVEALGRIGLNRVRARQDILKQLRVLAADKGVWPKLRTDADNLVKALDAAAPPQQKKDAEAATVLQVLDNAKVAEHSELTNKNATLGMKPYKEYKFKGEVGKIYTIELQSKDFDAYLYLKNETGETLAENGDAERGKALGSRIVFKVQKAGIYHIIVTSQGALVAGFTGTGTFLLTVGQADAAALVFATTGSGLKFAELRLGAGTLAAAGHTVMLKYTGRFKDGREFESSTGKAPTTFVLGKGKVIKGWHEGVAGMRVGGTRKLIIPPELGYGPNGSPERGIPKNAELHYEMELLKVIENKKSKGTSAPSAPSAPGQPNTLLDIVDRIEAAGGTKVHVITLRAGATYVIDMKHSVSSMIDPVLQLLDLNGKQAAFNDDYGDRVNARIIYTAVQAGRYRLVASGYGKTFGDYTLTVKRK